MATAREATVSHLHQQLEWMAWVRDDHAGEAWPERDGRVAGGLGDLRAVGLITEEEAEAWRARLLAPVEERPSAAPAARERAEGLLRELFEPVAPDDETGVELARFQGAVAALRAVGAAAPEWDERLRRRMGWPSEEELRELNAGGSREELLAVLAGPAEAADGVRVPFALRFSDGITVLIRRDGGVDEDEEWWDAELVDDLGSRYTSSGGGGGAAEMWLTFRTAPPAEATWVELRGLASEPIRVDL
jgi:hypothetical protein